LLHCRFGCWQGEQRVRSRSPPSMHHTRRRDARQRVPTTSTTGARRRPYHLLLPSGRPCQLLPTAGLCQLLPATLTVGRRGALPSRRPGGAAGCAGAAFFGRRRGAAQLARGGDIEHSWEEDETAGEARPELGGAEAVAGRCESANWGFLLEVSNVWGPHSSTNAYIVVKILKATNA
jgi:hypothetical protein